MAIYGTDGKLVCTLALERQPAGVYQCKSLAMYWDGKVNRVSSWRVVSISIHSGRGIHGDAETVNTEIGNANRERSMCEFLILNTRLELGRVSSGEISEVDNATWSRISGSRGTADTVCHS